MDAPFFVNAFVINGSAVKYLDNNKTLDKAVANTHDQVVAIVDSSKED